MHIRARIHFQIPKVVKIKLYIYMITKETNMIFFLNQKGSNKIFFLYSDLKIELGYLR